MKAAKIKSKEKSELKKLQDDAKFLYFSAGEGGDGFGWSFQKEIWTAIEDRFFGWLQKTEISSYESISPKDIFLACLVGRIIEGKDQPFEGPFESKPVKNKVELLKEIVEFGIETSYEVRPQDSTPYIFVRLKDKLAASGVHIRINSTEGFEDFKYYWSLEAQHLKQSLMLGGWLDFGEEGIQCGFWGREYLSEIWTIIEARYFGWLPKLSEYPSQKPNWDPVFLLDLGQKLGREPVAKRQRLLQEAIVHWMEHVGTRGDKDVFPWTLAALIAKLRLKDEQEKKNLPDETEPAIKTEDYENKTKAEPLSDKTQTAVLGPVRHPGEIIKKDLIEGIGLTVPEAIDRTKVGRAYMYQIIEGDRPLTKGVAIKLSVLFDECLEKTGKRFTVKGLLSLQDDHDLKDVNIAPHLIK